MSHSVLETVQKAPYGNGKNAVDAIKVLEGASVAELSYALANTSITPTTIARIVAFNCQLSETMPLSEQLELLSHIRKFASQISWAEAELYGPGIDRLVHKVAEMDKALTVLKAYILYAFAQSYNEHYGNDCVSLAHCLFVMSVGDQMPALTTTLLSSLRLSTAPTCVLRPTKNYLWNYFYQGALFLSKEKKFQAALYHCVASLALGQPAEVRLSIILVTVLILIVHGDTTLLKGRIYDSDARVRFKDLLAWFEDSPIEASAWTANEALADMVEPLNTGGLGFLIPHVLLARRLHRLRALHRTIRRTDWEQLRKTGPESLDELIEAGYMGQIYMQQDMTIIESPEYEAQLGDLYGMLDQTVQVAERLKPTPQ